MAKIRCQVTGPLTIGGVKRPGVVELDDVTTRIRALERAGHVQRLDTPGRSDMPHSFVEREGAETPTDSLGEAAPWGSTVEQQED